jgi:hypothetical protein
VVIGAGFGRLRHGRQPNEASERRKDALSRPRVNLTL